MSPADRPGPGPAPGPGPGAGRVEMHADHVDKYHDQGVVRVPERLALAEGLAGHGVFLPRLGDPWQVAGQWVSRWPRGQVVPGAGPDDAEPDWAALGTALGLLHRAGADLLAASPHLGAVAPRDGALLRARRAVDAAALAVADGTVVAEVRRGADPAAVLGQVRAAHDLALPVAAAAAARAPGRAVVHGDWHLGQLVTWQGSLLHLDPDDVGVGAREHDLARLEAMALMGVLPHGAWRTWRGAHRQACGLDVDPGVLRAVTDLAVVTLAAQSLVPDRHVPADVGLEALGFCRHLLRR